MGLPEELLGPVRRVVSTVHRVEVECPPYDVRVAVVAPPGLPAVQRARPPTPRVLERVVAEEERAGLRVLTECRQVHPPVTERREDVRRRRVRCPLPGRSRTAAPGPRAPVGAAGASGARGSRPQEHVLVLHERVGVLQRAHVESEGVVLRGQHALTPRGPARVVPAHESRARVTRHCAVLQAPQLLPQVYPSAPGGRRSAQGWSGFVHDESAVVYVVFQDLPFAPT